MIQMGKVRTRILGLEEVEKKQKEASKEKRKEKKTSVSRIGVRDDSEIATSPDVRRVPRDDKKRAKKRLKSTKQQKKIKGKKYQSAATKIDKTKMYSINEAVMLLKKISYTKFDESVELHVNVEKTGLRGEVELPHLTGKATRVVIMSDDLLKKLEGGFMDFDVLITSPSYMPKLARFAKVLGPKGLMPNPKAGTITDKPEAVAKKFEKGTLRWKTEPKFPLLHQMIGKVSHDEKALGENAKVILRSIGKQNISAAFIKTTMSPALKLNIEDL